MYQIPSEVLAEAPLHSALAICGAGGYMFMKHTKDIIARRAQSTQCAAAKLSTADFDEPEKPQLNADDACEASMDDSEQQVNIASELGSIVESKGQAHDATPTLPVSDRVAKLLAKKAARKARKALERQQLEQEVSAAAMVEEICVEAAVEQPLVEEAVPEIVEKAARCSLAELSTCDEGMTSSWNAEETVDDMEETEASMWGDMAEEEGTWTESAMQEYSSPPAAALQAASTLSHQSFAQPMWSHGSHVNRKWQRAAPSDDAWMTPFENTIRSREEAEQVYEQVYQMCAAAEAASRLQCEPVMVNGQQLYTDGNQFFMLACIDETQGTDAAGAPAMSFVVDAQDPLHAEFAKDVQAGLMPLPSAPF